MDKAMILILTLMLSAGALQALSIKEYYGTGCPHCARVDATLDALSDEYDLQIAKKEIYYDAANRQEMFEDYARFGLDPGSGGVPTLVLDERSILIGEMSEGRFREIFDAHISDPALGGVYTAQSSSPIEELDPGATLTPLVLVGAAFADSVNPCTIAVMTLLLGTVLRSKGKKGVLLSAMAFISVIFFAYLLMGLGILRAIADSALTNAFFSIVTFGALILAAMELKAYFRYKPGFGSIEIPLFLRPFMKRAIAEATSMKGVAFAALICSLFLLPCSSGPYLIVLSMLAKSWTLSSMLYLIIYNLIFVLPMVVVAFVIYAGMMSVEQVSELREEHIRKLHLIAGLIFLILFLVLLAQMLGVQ